MNKVLEKNEVGIAMSEEDIEHLNFLQSEAKKAGISPVEFMEKMRIVMRRLGHDV